MLDELSRQRVKHLCELIAKEQDHHRFSVLMKELNDLLDGTKDGDADPYPSRDGDPNLSQNEPS
jgi:hypothetical protein